MTANRFDEPLEMVHNVASIEKGSIQNDFGICMRNQIYNGSSCQAVVCRCCGTRETSGSWRRGWKVRAILDDKSIQPMSDDVVANLCNRCGQRWAKMGKLETEDLKSVMTCFVHATTHKGSNGQFPLDGVYRKRRRSSLENDTNENRIRTSPLQGDAQYIGYTTTRVSGGKSSYALFWVMDKMARYTLVAIGVDARSSGHFIYQKSPLVQASLPALHCTNRSETFKWIQANFRVENPLAASLKANVPELHAEHIEKILRGEGKRIDRSDEKDVQQHLCATCGCNHPSEECPTNEPTGAGVVLNTDDDLSDPFGPTSPIPAYFDLDSDTIPDLPDGISPLVDHIFSSPKDYTPRSVEGFAAPQHCNSPDALLTNVDVIEKKSIQRVAMQQMTPHDIIIVKTKSTDTGMQDTLTAWARMLEDFATETVTHIGTQHVLEVLQQLLSSDTISLHDISESRILFPVSQLCTHRHPMIASMARRLADMWRSLAVTAIRNNSSTIL